MKKTVLLLVLAIISSCDRKVSYYDLKNDNETYYRGNDPFTGQAVSDIETKSPSTVYEFNDGQKLSEIEYYSNNKIKTEKHYFVRLLESEKEYSQDGLLLKKESYVWDNSRQHAEVYIEWYDWCGKVKRRKSLKCDKSFIVSAVNYDQNIPQPCN